MLSKNLFEEVLVQPVESGANKLYVVSGYATAAVENLAYCLLPISICLSQTLNG